MTAWNEVAVLVVRDDERAPLTEVAPWLRETLREWPELDAVLVGVVVGELCDNARRWGAPPFAVELALDRWMDVLKVSVCDRETGSPRGWRLGAGLLLVDALVDRWGVSTKAGATTVWAEVSHRG
ncbi:hypothetical protein [Saccharothrix xinjiangensis]|uniref:ATP-binding protein n=1 Tax=Saccharothrix xinjiangensis TaxID=204798 RepID=A0ABV9YES2_9PSEU